MVSCHFLFLLFHACIISTCNGSRNHSTATAPGTAAARLRAHILYCTVLFRERAPCKHGAALSGLPYCTVQYTPPPGPLRQPRQLNHVPTGTRPNRHITPGFLVFAPH